MPPLVADATVAQVLTVPEGADWIAAGDVMGVIARSMAEGALRP